MPAEETAYCQESLIRLKPGLQIIDARTKNSNFISRDSYPTFHRLTVPIQPVCQIAQVSEVEQCLTQKQQ